MLRKCVGFLCFVSRIFVVEWWHKNPWFFFGFVRNSVYHLRACTAIFWVTSPICNPEDFLGGVTSTPL